jgi:hypothetical protein
MSGWPGGAGAAGVTNVVVVVVVDDITDNQGLFVSWSMGYRNLESAVSRTDTF